jgi:hypothetical protein
MCDYFYLFWSTTAVTKTSPPHATVTNASPDPSKPTTYQIVLSKIEEAGKLLKEIESSFPLLVLPERASCVNELSLVMTPTFNHLLLFRQTQGNQAGSMVEVRPASGPFAPVGAGADGK